jgi:hypothetical protein
VDVEYRRGLAWSIRGRQTGSLLVAEHLVILLTIIATFQRFEKAEKRVCRGVVIFGCRWRLMELVRNRPKRSQHLGRTTTPFRHQVPLNSRQDVDDSEVDAQSVQSWSEGMDPLDWVFGSLLTFVFM